jgi:hypothetical protein
VVGHHIIQGTGTSPSQVVSICYNLLKALRIQKLWRAQTFIPLPLEDGAMFPKRMTPCGIEPIECAITEKVKYLTFVFSLFRLLSKCNELPNIQTRDLVTLFTFVQSMAEKEIEAIAMILNRFEKVSTYFEICKAVDQKRLGL